MKKRVVKVETRSFQEDWLKIKKRKKNVTIDEESRLQWCLLLFSRSSACRILDRRSGSIDGSATEEEQTFVINSAWTIFIDFRNDLFDFVVGHVGIESFEDHLQICYLRRATAMAFDACFRSEHGILLHRSHHGCSCRRHETLPVVLVRLQPLLSSWPSTQEIHPRWKQNNKCLSSQSRSTYKINSAAT